MKKSIKQLMILAICLFIFYQNSTMVNAEEEPTEVLQDLRIYGLIPIIILSIREMKSGKKSMVILFFHLRNVMLS